MHTNFTEKFQYTPYIFLYGAPECGKTRTGKGLIYVSYRGVYVESTREAFLLRLSSYFHTSLFYDCRDFWGKTVQNKSDDVILVGFEKGSSVPRVQYPERGPFKDIVYYSNYCPKILASNYPIDVILNSRCIIIKMQKSDKIFQSDITEKSCLSLKERLLALRAKYFLTDFPQVEKPAAGRLGDMLKPIAQIVSLLFSNPDVPYIVENFKEFIKKQEEIIYENTFETPEITLIKSIFLLENEVRNGVLSIKAITKEFNSGRDIKFRKSDKSIGRLVKKLGFTGVTLSDGTRGIEYYEKLIEALMITHGLESIVKDRKNRKKNNNDNQQTGESK